MSEQQQQIGRLAMRQEGGNWNAYYALPASMEQPIFLGSIRMGAVVGHPERKAAFMDMMRDVVSDCQSDFERIVITRNRRIAMSRELRRVPKDWEHPKREDGRYIALFDGYRAALQEFEDAIKEKGLVEAIDYYGGGPTSEDYMPDWTEAERTHYMMYETTSEGTPISPVCETPEELAHWLADNQASAFGKSTATYEQWLNMIRDPGWAPSAVMDEKGLRSGVAL